MQMELIAFVFFKVNVEQWPFELNPAREVFGFSSREQPSPKRKKAPIILSPGRAGVGFEPEGNGSRRIWMRQ